MVPDKVNSDSWLSGCPAPSLYCVGYECEPTDDPNVFDVTIHYSAEPPDATKRPTSETIPV